jgi:hypothetical protein
MFYFRFRLPYLNRKLYFRRGENEKIFCREDCANIQSDQQESKSEQALQIIGHVVAESYANKRSKHGRRQFVVSNASL